MLYNPEFSSAENTATIHLHSLDIYFVVLTLLKSFHSRTVIVIVPKGPPLPAVQLLTELPEAAVAPLNIYGARAFSLISQRSYPGRSHKKTRFRGLGLQQLR